MMILKGNIFVCFGLTLQAISGVASSGVWRSATRATDTTLSSGNALYQTTVTTEMGYHQESRSMSREVKGHSDVYEYLPATDHYESSSSKGTKSGKKGAKKSGYSDRDHSIEEEHTLEPTEHDAYSASKRDTRPPQTHAPTHVDVDYPGKGKGGPGYPRSKSGKGKGSSSSSASGKGKGKGGKGSKSSKGKGNGDHLTPHPAPSGSADYPSTRPPSAILFPTTVPAPSEDMGGSITASPTDSGSVPFDLTPFALLYETETKRQASRLELVEVTDVTRLYLEEFMFDELTGSAFTFLDDFITRMITSTFVMGGDTPYIIDYSATARYNPFSTVFPSQEQLDEALTIAFTGANLAVYIDRLTGLPEDNVFFGAQVFFSEPVLRAPHRSDDDNAAAAIAAAAVAATLIAAGIVLYKRRKHLDENTKDLDKKGDATVAGETYSGYSYDGTSVSQSSTYRDHDEDDEEALRSRGTLGTIKEMDDDSNMKPSWGSPDARSFDEDDFNESEASNDNAARFPIPPAESFDQMALQGLATMDSSAAAVEDSPQVEAATELPKDNIDGKLPSRPMMSGMNTPRPRTIEEIEAMLAEDKDDASLSFSADSAPAWSALQRPRTVEEIESLLSEGLDDDDMMSDSSSVLSHLNH